MTDSTLSPYDRAQLTAMRVQEQTGLSAAELASLPIDEFARLTGRQTPAQAAIAAYNRQQDAARPPQNVTGSEAAAYAPSPDDPHGIDLNAIDWSKVSATEYQRIRAELGINVASAEGMSRASLSMESRLVARREIGPSGRIQFGRFS